GEENMASAASSPTRPFYGPINPAILVFDWEEEEEEDTGSAVETPVPNQPQQQTAPDPQTGSSRALSYWPFNHSLLRDFDDDAASVISGMATDGGSVAGEDVAGGTVPTDRARSVASLLFTPSPIFEAIALAFRRDEVGVQGARGHSTRETVRQRETSPDKTEPARSSNPYSMAIEDKQKAMTVAFLRSPARTASTDVSSSLAPDDIGFGQRYQVTEETASVVITNQRRLPDILSGERECIICTDTKPVSEFPTAAITKACDHEPTTCLLCVATSIQTDLNNRLWNEIKCPECRATLEYDDVQRFADDATKDRYQTLSFRSAISASPTFFWCTSGCGYGQVHAGGRAQPIVTCRLCAHRSCFQHKVAWHENLTCDEYDALAADPANFRSRFDRDNEEAALAAAARQVQEDADRVFAQGLLAADQRAVAEERAERERVAREEREERERVERERREKEVREGAVRRKAEEEASGRTVGSTTKPCPGCSAPIEKNEGCAHMTCTWCKHAFCWNCLADHKQILEGDNSAHQKKCPWHPDNIKE
ncbi:hypothetical protein C8A00DRAFT_19598, partial [Chaetomidium leptoderma]